MPSRERIVAVTIPVGPPHIERIRRGILDYAAEKGNWSLRFGLDGTSLSLEGLHHFRGDGIIVMPETMRDFEIARSIRLPTVNLASSDSARTLNTVTIDNFQAGVEAGRHLVERGYRRFAYYGVKGLHYSEERQAGFREATEAVCGDMEVFEEPSDLDPATRWKIAHTELDDWLARIEKPAGLLAAHDYRAALIHERCPYLNIHLPRDLGLVGMDDDACVCEGTLPTITSVRHDGEAIGYEAAALLDHLMDQVHIRNTVKPKRILVPPAKIVARKSTDVYITDDPRLAAAVAFMREHFHEGITIPDILENLSGSRRWLERACKKQFGISPYHFLCRMRVRHAEALLREDPGIHLDTLVGLCGFSDTRNLKQVCRRFRSEHTR